MEHDSNPAGLSSDSLSVLELHDSAVFMPQSLSHINNKKPPKLGGFCVAEVRFGVAYQITVLSFRLCTIHSINIYLQDYN